MVLDVVDLRDLVDLGLPLAHLFTNFGQIELCEAGAVILFLILIVSSSTVELLALGKLLDRFLKIDGGGMANEGDFALSVN